MRVASTAMLLVSMFCVAVSVPRAGQGPESRSAPIAGVARLANDPAVSAIVTTYCASCHNGVMRSPSNALLDRLDAAAIEANPDVWSRAYRQLAAGAMPPVGAPRPDRAASGNLLASIDTALGGSAPLPANATSQEIAERLAIMLWNSPPDEALLSDARSNRLAEAGILERHIQRMLADDRADAFVSRFFFPWLGLDRLVNADPDKKYFPDYDISLRQAMVTETRLFILSQLRDDLDPIALWNARYSFLNEQLARHYGIPGVTGTQFRRISFSTLERAGLLGQGSILMATSRHQHGADAGYTSPATRAVWIRTRFLGAPPPRPFPNAQPVKPGLPITPQTRSLPAEPCVHCHQNFFPLGYALEHFDPIGRWRELDQLGPVDASGAYVDGTPIDGTAQLRDVLLQYPEAFRTTITEKLLMYAAGKPANAGTSSESLIRARQVLHTAQPPSWSALIAAIVRTAMPEEKTSSAGVPGAGNEGAQAPK